MRLVTFGFTRLEMMIAEDAREVPEFSDSAIIVFDIDATAKNGPTMEVFRIPPLPVNTPSKSGWYSKLSDKSYVVIPTRTDPARTVRV